MKSLLIFYFSAATAQIAPNLKAFIGAPEGIAFRGNNGLILTHVHDYQNYYTWAVREFNEPFTKFMVHETEDEHLLFECYRLGPGIGEGSILERTTLCLSVLAFF